MWSEESEFYQEKLGCYCTKRVVWSDLQASIVGRKTGAESAHSQAVQWCLVEGVDGKLY